MVFDTLEGHSYVEDEEKCGDGQENWQTRKGRRRLPCMSTATALCISLTNQSRDHVHEPYSDCLI